MFLEQQPPKAFQLVDHQMHLVVRVRNLHEEIPKGGQLRMRQEGLNEGGEEGVYGVCQVREAQS